MRIEELTVEVRDGSLERVGQILPADLVGFKASLRFNNVGSWEIELPANHAMADALRQPSAGIVVTGLAGVLFSGPTTAATNSKTNDNPQGTWKIQGVTDSVILSERLAYPSPAIADVSAQTASNDIRTGQASTVILGYVDDNIGPNAPVEREIPGLAVMTDPLIGSTVYGSARFDVLGELISGLASIDQLGFDIRQTDGSLEFYIYQPVDRSGYIRMDVLNNTLSKAEYAYGNHSLSRAIVAGQGQGTDRQFLEITSTESIEAETVWGRRIETFIDQRNTSDVNELTQAGVEALADGGATLTSIDVIPSNDLTMRFGIDWGLGDRVSVEVGDQEIQAIVTNVAISVESDGVRVGATVGEPTGVDYEALVAKKQVSTAKRINALERKEGGGGAASDVEIEVKNVTGSTLYKGQAVYITGSTGANLTISLAQANAEATSSKTLGLLKQDLANGEHGLVITEGFLDDIDTSGKTAGDPIWLSPTTPGGLVFGLANKPTAPNHMVFIGYVLRVQSNNGGYYVKVQNGFELDELHDVKITAPTSGQAVVYDGSKWINGQATSQSDIPTGSIIATSLTTAPAGWLICDGAAVSRTTYANLFGVIGTTYGAGNGSTTFNLPDLRGRVAVGKNGGSFGTLGATGGSETVTLTEAQMPSHTHTEAAHTHTFSGTTNTTGAHTHTLTGSNGGSSGVSMAITGNTNNDFNFGPMNGARANSNGDHSHTFSGTTSATAPTTNATGGGQAHSNLQPYQVVNYIIKYTSAFASTDTELAGRVGTLETTMPTKAPLASPSFTGNVSVGSDLTVTGETYLNGTEIQGDGKTIVRYSDTWMRLNPDNDFSNGIYAGTGLLRTDGNFQIGNNGSTMYVDGSTFNYNGLPASGLVPVKPTSIANSGGSIAANGRVSLTSGTGVFLNGIFTSKYRNYKIMMDTRNMGGSYLYFRFCYSDNNYTSVGAYYGGGFYRQYSSTGIWQNTGDGYSYGSIGYTGDGGHTNMEIFSPQWNGSYGKVLTHNSYGAGGHTMVWSDFMWNGWDAFTGIYIYNSGANWNAEIEVYGYNH